YSLEPAAMRQYQDVLDPDRARKAFTGSKLIHHLWPADLVDRTVPFFEYERIVNRILLEGGQPLRQIEDLHALLTKTSLETIPLWLLGSDAVIRRIAEGASTTNPTAEYVRALDALARRDYRDAVSRFEHAETLKVQAASIRPLLVYALCLNGR